jgi:Family of unknown function (DUF6262)
MCGLTTAFTSPAPPRRRHEQTRAKVIAAMHELDRSGAVLTFESVARHAGVSRSWIYTQADIKDEIRTTPRPAPARAERTATHPAARQRDSLRQRLEIANRRNRELADENQRLRRQLACALGQLRDDTGRRDEPTHRSSVTIGPR